MRGRATEPVSRIRRAALQTDNLFTISRREVSMMSTLAATAGFASHRRHNGGLRRLFPGSHDQPTHKFALASRRKKFSLTACVCRIFSSPSEIWPSCPGGLQGHASRSASQPPGIVVGVPLQDMYGDLLPDFQLASRWLIYIASSVCCRTGHLDLDLVR